ncbi:MAG: adenylate/guanylate cyclase domain-containing protein [Rhodospirillaceae bacterium]|nr:MAG: adenylate/guanylate cyclase domain-containing protein [Rhodospirillaceae bacterium]
MKAATPLAALRNRVKAINWSRFANLRAWRRWFVTSLVQSGRLTVLLALIFVYFVRVDDPTWLQYLRARTFDVYQQIKPRPFHPDTPVVIVDIDEKSIAELAQWQWPRTILAKLVDRLTEMGAKAIAFDIVFAEPDRTSFRTLAASPGVDLDDETRARLSRTRDNDEVFAESIKASGRVVLGQPIVTTSKTYPEERPATSFVAIGSDPNPNLEQFPGILRNLYEIDAAGDGHGIFAYSSSIDGIVRSVPMVIRAENVRYPSLSLETLRIYQGARSIYIKSGDDGIQGLLLRSHSGQKYEVSTDRHSEVRVYYTPSSAYHANYISVTDIINGRVDPARIAGKMVLVGTSAQGLVDIRSTPLDPIIPGVEVHANILENVVFGEGLVRPPIAEGLEVIAAMTLSLVVIVVTPWVGAIIGAFSFLVCSSGLTWWSWNAFAQHRELYDPVFAVVVAFIIYSFLTLAAFNREEGQKKQIRGAFGQYLSPAVVEQLASDPSQLKLGGENRDMTFMFSDVRGFTTISELFDAEGLTKLINRLLTPLTDVILKRQGTIDKYMGDCVMAFWNAPLPVQDHEREACRSSFEMLEAVNQLNQVLEAEAKLEHREHRPLAVGIGINSGIACVGNMGSTQRFGYSVLGDNVNLASRLEGQSKAYGVTIVIGEATSEKVQDFAVLELDLIKVKGKTEAVRIFTLVGDEPVAKTADYLALKIVHDQMLAAYRNQRWDEADAKIAEAHTITARASGLIHQMAHFYDIYAERVAEYRAHPPGPNWDAVYVATSK